MSASAKKTKAPAKKKSGGDGTIDGYTAAQTPEHAAICEALRAEIEAALPKSPSKVWHGAPVWWVGECPVTGYNVTSKKGITLLFWNGQAFDEEALQPIGKFKAAQIQFTDVSQIDRKALRRWLKKAGTMIWDLGEVRRGRQS